MFLAEYMLKIVRVLAVCAFLVHSVSDTDTASVNEGDSLTLHTGIKTNPQDRIVWYFNKTRLTYMYRNEIILICTDDACKEIFKERLKLNNTGDLTITNVKATDAGVYKLLINSDSYKTFNVAVLNTSEHDEVKNLSVKEAESITLDPGPVGKNANNLMKLYFNEIHIAEVSKDLRYICPDVQCDERFRDRLELDKHTGSLTITDARTTDSGEYTLLIIDRTHSFSITTEKRFSVDVAKSDSSLPTEARRSISYFVIVVFGFVIVAILCKLEMTGNTAHRTLGKVAESKILTSFRNVTLNMNPATRAEHKPLTSSSEGKIIPDSFHLVDESPNSQQQNAVDQNQSNFVLQQTHLNSLAPGVHGHFRRRAQTTDDISVTRSYVQRRKTRSYDSVMLC